MTGRRIALRVAFWLAIAVLVTWPASGSPNTLLIGHPDVDVWNHAWGYWFIPHQISSLQWPFSTDLIGVPEGGDLYFIDFLGALLGTPLAWVFGPAVAYNGVMIARLASAGLAGTTLAERVVGPGPHCAIAGVGLVTLPFLLAEMSNGISEVIAIHWIVWVLWAGLAALDTPSRSAWLRVGILGGIATMANFYFGLVSAMMLAVLALARWVPAWTAGERPSPKAWRQWGQGMAAGLVVAAPSWLAFQWSLHSAKALIVRPQAFSEGWILDHNAVDPRTYLMPGAFQSVDLAAYGEAFVHTGYLRWSVIGLAVVGLLKNKTLRVWAGAAAVSLVLGLGPILYFGEWVRVGGHAISLPFYWAQLVLPDVAITHPLRLSIGGQIAVCVMAAGGAAAMSWRWLSLGAMGLIMIESLGFSAGPWPIPTAPATVPAAISELDNSGPILDLPGSVGATMATSRYFWYQTQHGRPIPYSPNARLGSCRDLELQSAFTDPIIRQAEHRVVEHPAAGPDLYQQALAKRYGTIVLHRDLEDRARLPSAYGPILRREFGPPTIDGDLEIWSLGGTP
jgi:hypothetical protein